MNKKVRLYLDELLKKYFISFLQQQNLSGMKNKIFIIISLLHMFSCGKDMEEPGNLVPATVDQNLSLPSAPINGTLLHLEVFGDPKDPLLIILHGGPGADYRSMLNAKAFVDDGFYLIFYDQRGSGLSKREDSDQYKHENSFQLFIDDLDQIISKFRSSDAQKVFLLGHSWGAMLATAYINQNPMKISGAVLAEPGGFTWTQTEEYLSRSNKINFFSEALNNATFPDQIFGGQSEHEVLDYKATFFSNFENAPGNTIGNAGHYPFWRHGSVAFQSLISNAEEHGFDFTTHLNQYTTKILFLYSKLNQAYGIEWAETVSSPYPNVDINRVDNSGHEMLYFGWPDFYPKSLNYLINLK